ncbi:hypothetical protein SAY87_005571 [Trapa incisa]|uniref:NAD-dependent epimerase/dehydratase domain-containing protein n=1 Tax=Trapa incisa TaxID=236973 RepID=A0AAN7K339_9MYRT|nr:hypothetical protein SAY87_005571 [Trapa incisa]
MVTIQFFFLSISRQHSGSGDATGGLQDGEPAAGGGLGFLELRLRFERECALLGIRPNRPVSLYAAAKKAGEEITHTYNHIYGLSITGLRFFTVYGPWGRPDMAYFSFARNILQGKPITVYHGKNRVDLARDFTYIDNIVKGCVRSLDTAGKSTGSGGKYRIFNLGNTSPVTVPALVSILERHLKVKAKRNVVDMPGNGDVLFTHANISLARTELGYKPTTDLGTGLKKFVKWY